MMPNGERAAQRETTAAPDTAQQPEPLRAEAPGTDTVRADAVRADAVRPEAVRPEAVHHEAVRGAAVDADAAHTAGVTGEGATGGGPSGGGPAGRGCPTGESPTSSAPAGGVPTDSAPTGAGPTLAKPTDAAPVPGPAPALTPTERPVLDDFAPTGPAPAPATPPAAPRRDVPTTVLRDVAAGMSAASAASSPLPPVRQAGAEEGTAVISPVPMPAAAPDTATLPPPTRPAEPLPAAAPPPLNAPAPDPQVTASFASVPPHQAQPQAPAPAQVRPPVQAQPQTPAPSPYPPGVPGIPASTGTFSSLPVVDNSLVGTRRKPRHGEPLAGRVLRAVRRTVSSSAAREVATASRTAELLQQPVATGRQIAVTSIRGGAGKSTVAALVGTAYAHYRHDPVLLVEADPALGTLPFRLGAPSLRWTVRDLAAMIEPSMSLLDITGYLVQLPDNAWLLPGSKGEVGAMLDTKAYEKAMVALRRYFGVTVVDCETLPAEVARTALSAAHARVLVAPATFEGVASTHSVLKWMSGLPRQVVAGTVVVLTQAVPHGGLDVDKAVEKLRATGATVHLLPYDRHLAAGGEISTELLAHSTREAVTHIAADALSLSLRRP